ncbi:nickel-type superoxide dismutase maturation protease [Streptomyces turgidiscabies]|uniref:nickel-type superoxide dismutase maturation protease n=1 Tax=Streptomyces TaxID=1883 RepID=UPI0005CAB359|nr:MULTISPECIES: nickel-type superoxide dismutase maturation protease [Streptomyces]MDX3495493.1 nickel-type superoxide dismutase maturation protease [Streptomyces turgidiscabies]GAQ70181.1 peptidase S24-like protein [Streptomyces turgidiscabies]
MPELSQESEHGSERESEHESEHGGAAKAFGWVAVTGPSMVPTLYHGDFLVVRYGGRVRAGDIVVLRHPFQQDLLVVKRATERREGGWWVLGDNSFAGGDSTDYGTVPHDLILGRVRFRYRPLKPGQRSLLALLRWAVSAARPVFSDRSASSRLRAR